MISRFLCQFCIIFHFFALKQSLLYFLFIRRAIFIFMLALVGVFYPYNRGALYSALVIIYALTSGIAGYSAASYYRQLEGVHWVGTCYKQLMKIPLLLVHVFADYCGTLMYTGSQSAVDRLPVLWPIVFDLLLLEYSSNCLQLYCGTAFRHYRRYPSYMGSGDITFTGFGWNSW